MIPNLLIQIEQVVREWNGLERGHLESALKVAVMRDMETDSYWLGLKLVNAIRKRTRGNVYDYDYWECGYCKWHPGGSEGPPQKYCGNCKQPLYVEDVNEAKCLIRVTKTNIGFGFELVRELNRVPVPAIVEVEGLRELADKMDVLAHELYSRTETGLGDEAEDMANQLRLTIIPALKPRVPIIVLAKIEQLRERCYLNAKDEPTDSYERNSNLGAMDVLDELGKWIIEFHPAAAAPQSGEGKSDGH